MKPPKSTHHDSEKQMASRIAPLLGLFESLVSCAKRVMRGTLLRALCSALEKPNVRFCRGSHAARAAHILWYFAFSHSQVLTLVSVCSDLSFFSCVFFLSSSCSSPALLPFTALLHAAFDYHSFNFLSTWHLFQSNTETQKSCFLVAYLSCVWNREV